MVVETEFGAEKISGRHILCVPPRLDSIETAAFYGVVARHRLGAWRDVVKDIENDERTKSVRAMQYLRSSTNFTFWAVSEKPASG